MRTAVASSRVPSYLLALSLLLLGCAGSSEPSGAPSPTPASDSTAPDPTASDPADCTPAGSSATRDVVYRPLDGVDDAQVSLDLYTPDLPDGCGPPPVLVWVHGGGFSAGDKSHRVDDKVAWATDNGWALAAVNYRLSPRPAALDDPDRVMYPDHNDDLTAALGWLADHADTHHLDLDRTMLLGHSAGAFLVALQATDEGFSPAGVQIVCTVPNDGGSYDLAEMAGRAGAAPALYRNAFGDDRAVWDAASPVVQAGVGASPGSFLVITRGGEERADAAEALAAAVRRGGGTAEVLDAGAYSHLEVNQAIGRPGEQVVTPRVTEFLRGCAGPSGA